jgi:hypothetical protein
VARQDGLDIVSKYDSFHHSAMKQINRHWRLRLPEPEYHYQVTEEMMDLWTIAKE